MAGVVAVKQFEGLAHVRFFESLGAAGDIRLFHAADTEPVPGGVEHFAKGDEFEDIARLEFFEECRFQFFVFLLFGFVDDVGAAGKAVLKAIGSRTGLSSRARGPVAPLWPGCPASELF